MNTLLSKQQERKKNFVVLLKQHTLHFASHLRSLSRQRFVILFCYIHFTELKKNILTKFSLVSILCIIIYSTEKLQEVTF